MSDRMDQRRVPAKNRISAAERRKHIITTATQLFERLGYAQTSMDRIAEVVGIRKPSLYYYFHSKESILIEMHDEMIEHIISAHEKRSEKSEASASELILGMITDIISLQESHPGSLRIFFEHQKELPKAEHKRIMSRRDLYEQLLREQLLRGIDGGEFTGVDVRTLGFAILGMANWSYQWFSPDGPMSAEQVAERFWDMLMTGIGTTAANSEGFEAG